LDLLPSQSAAGASDATAIMFAEGTGVDISRAYGYVDGRSPEGEIYCVAPVSNKYTIAEPGVQFFAAGINCCGKNTKDLDSSSANTTNLAQVHQGGYGYPSLVNSILVQNLADKTTKQDLQAAFTPFGTVKSSFLAADGGRTYYGMVQMNSKDEVSRAITALNGQLQSDGMKWTVKLPQDPAQGGTDTVVESKGEPSNFGCGEGGSGARGALILALEENAEQGYKYAVEGAAVAYNLMPGTGYLLLNMVADPIEYRNDKWGGALKLLLVYVLVYLIISSMAGYMGHNVATKSM